MSNDPLKSIREEYSRGEVHACISSISQLLNQYHQKGGAGDAPRPCTLNKTQVLRLFLLRCDCYSYLRSHQRALEDARAAIELTHALSPQAFFMAGREYYRLGSLKEALEQFESGETLMSSGVGEAERCPDPAQGDSGAGSKEENSRQWAEIGVYPPEAPHQQPPPLTELVASDSVACPVIPSYEWVQDLQLWRKYHSEAKLLAKMAETHVVPIHLSKQAMEFALKQSSTQQLVDQAASGRSPTAAGAPPSSSAPSGGKSLIVMITNNTDCVLRYSFEHISCGEIVQPFVFPQTIQPKEVAFALLSGTSWTSGLRGVVAYTVEMAASLRMAFESPLVSDYQAGVALRPGKSESLKSSGDYKSLLKPVLSCSDEVRVGSAPMGHNPQRVVKAMVTSISRVIGFTVVQVQTKSNALSVAEFVSVCEFLPPQALRRCTTLSRSIRTAIGHFPPTWFYAPPRIAMTSTDSSSDWYPNYALPLVDVASNPWLVRDTAPIFWQLAFDGFGSQPDIEEYSWYDSSDHRVLTFAMESSGKSFVGSAFYGTTVTSANGGSNVGGSGGGGGGVRRRQLIAKFSDTWNPFSTAVLWKASNGRHIANMEVGSTEVRLVLIDEHGTSGSSNGKIPLLALKKHQGGGKAKRSPLTAEEATGNKRTPLFVVTHLPSGLDVAEVFAVPLKRGSSLPKKGDAVAEIMMKPMTTIESVTGGRCTDVACDAYLCCTLAAFGKMRWQ